MIRSLIVLAALAVPVAAQPMPSDRDALTATAAQPARVSLTRTGPWLPTPSRVQQDFAVLDDSGPRPQFIAWVDGARLLLHVDRDALQRRVLDSVLLQPTATNAIPKSPFRAVGMMLHASAEVDVDGPAKDGFTNVRVRSTSPLTEVTGFVPTALIGTAARWKALEGQPTWKPDAMAPAELELLAAPKGKAFVRVQGEKPTPMMVLERKSGFALVRLEIGAIGWIAGAKLKKLPRDFVEGGEEGGVEGGEVGGVAVSTLADHTPLYDRIDGTFVGEAFGFKARVQETKGAWKRFELRSEYGPISVWASPAKPQLKKQ